MAGRGRAKGRGKPREATQPPLQQAPGQGPTRGPSYAQMGGGTTAPQQAARPPPAAAWGPPVGAPARAPQRAPEAVAAVAGQMQQMNIGAGASRPAPSGDQAARGGNGNGNGAAPAGRGAMRGGRQVDFPETRRTRPENLQSKQGTDGRALNLRANYFKIGTVPDWALHQYRVDIAPEEDRTFIRKKLLRVHREKLGGYLFDGTVLYTSNPLTSPQVKTITLTSKLDAAPNAEQVPDHIFTITVKEVGEVAKGDFAYIQIFNLLLRTCIGGLDLQLVGRDYYDAKARVPVPKFKLELWPGYKTSIRQHERDILMCVEITHKVMRMETVLDILAECYQRQGDYKRDFVKEVVGCIVLTKYNNKTYRVDDVDWSTTPNHKFDMKGEQVTYAEYMMKKYQIPIRDSKQPMLVSKAKARDVRAGMAETVNLIPEVCFCTGLTDNMRANNTLMRELANHTRVAPNLRIQKLRAFNARLQSNERAIEQLRTFEMTLERDIIKLPGRIVDEEKILFGGSKTALGGESVDWTRDLRNNPMLFLKELTNWVVVVPSKFKRDAIAFVDFLKKASGGMRFRVGDPEIFDIQRDNASEYVQVLSHILDKGQPQLIMCAVPNNRGDRYSAIKKKCCVDRAVATQVILTKNLNDAKKTMSIATKVAIQMNCKIGGSPWSVGIPLGGLMVVGFDVCHDTSSKAQSFGAMVASLDKAMSRYFSAVTPHTNGEELSNNLALNICRAVKKYHTINSTLPTHILIYRDGVGEGQIPQVVSYELDMVKSKLAQLYGTVPVKMTFVIVTKRINTRIFTEQERNPPPGTVVDDVVTDPEKYDFFLVSQSVRDGTVSPTSYNVIHDGMAMPAGRLQRLTYKMCHLYFNWSGTVRVPAQCQYAHKLAFLVGQSLHREPSSQLEDLLYFL